MSNELLIPPEIDTQEITTNDKEPDLLHEVDGSMWTSLVSNLRDAFASSKQPPLELTSKPGSDDLIIKEEPVWTTLASSVQDLFFPKKLPPLELTSTPVAMRDLLYEKRSPWPGIVSLVFMCGLTAVIVYWVTIKVRPIARKTMVADNVDVTPWVPVAPKMQTTMGGGGGGGDHDLVQVSKGRLPKLAKTQITPPQIIRNDHPKLAVEPTIVMPQNVPLPNANMPNIGLPTSTQVQLASNGTGSGAGMGSGAHGGLGSGTGGGYGPGEGGGTGGGMFHVGGGVSAPQVIYSVDPEFSDEARRAKYQGIVVVNLVVDAQGNPQRVRVIRPLGMGLDEKAIQAVRQYKFKPAMYQGKAVPVEVSIEVNFRIY